MSCADGEGLRVAAIGFGGGRVLSVGLLSGRRELKSFQVDAGGWGAVGLAGGMRVGRFEVLGGEAVAAQGIAEGVELRELDLFEGPFSEEFGLHGFRRLKGGRAHGH